MPLQRRSGEEHFQFRRSCKFIGSLAITLLHGKERQHYVNEKLLEMKDVGKGISVVILVTDEGIKILKDDESAVKMAHGITRIAFSTCQPEKKLFAYVSKMQTSEGNAIMQAHMFKSKKGHHTQELSSAISKAFQIAYTRNSSKRANRVNLFEMEAKDKKEVLNAERKRWAKSELANGHDHSGHALRARGIVSRKRVSSDVQKLLDNIDKEKKLITEKTEVGNMANRMQMGDPNVCSQIKNGNTSTEYDEKSTDNCFVNGENNINCINISKNKKLEPPPTPKPRNVIAKTNPNLLETEVNNSLNNDPKNLPSTKSDTEVERKISCESTSLEDWDIIKLTSSENMPHKLVVPITKFGALQEVEENGKDFEDVFTGEQEELSMTANTQFDSTFDLSRLTMSENQIVQDAEWYQIGFSREIAETILRNRPVGSFFIRNSFSTPGCYVITIKPPATVKENGCLNYLIENTPDGFLRIRGFEPKFPSLLFLVAHYSADSDEIPCRLHSTNSSPLLFLPKDDIDDLDGLRSSQEIQLDFSDEGNDEDYENFCSNTAIMREFDELQF